MALSGTNSGSTSNIKLAQDIHEEFLICKICLEPYKTPKCLSCLHTFCEACIENHAFSETSYKKYSDYRDFTCPLCRKRTQLPTGGVKKLPDNFLVSSLQDLVNRQRPVTSYPFCDICRTLNRRHRDAQAKCIDCSKLLCRTCTEQHRDTRVTRNHSIIDVDTEKDIECKEHKDELVRFYCLPCEVAICILCTVSDHKEHEISSFPEAVTRFKDDIAATLETCKSKLGQLEARLVILGQTSNNVQETEQMVREAAINFISDIRSREKVILEELHSMFDGSTAEDLQKKKQELQTEVDSLRSTCSLAEIVLKGRDLELLMLKKQVQSKLKMLSAIDTRTLFLQKAIPRIEFWPGAVDLGTLQQIDLEDEKKLTSKEPSSCDDGDFTVDKQANDSKAQSPHQPLSGRLSRGSMGDITQNHSLSPPNNFGRSSSYTNFDTSLENGKGVNLPGDLSHRSDSFCLVDASTQTKVPSLERGTTCLMLPPQRSKACQLEVNEIDETFAELNADLSDEELQSTNIVWLCSQAPETDELEPSEKGSQTENVEMVDVAVNTRCRVVQRQSNSGSGSSSSATVSSPPLLTQTQSTGSGSEYSPLASAGSLGLENCT